MIKISTKRMQNGKWVCFATIDCYDYTFEGSSQLEAKSKMIELLNKKGIIEVHWEDPVIYESSNNGLEKGKKNIIRYSRSRIDNNPIA